MKCFSGVDVIEQPDEKGIFRLANEYGDGEWNDQVDDELGNFDFLMGANVEFRNAAVSEELKYWGRWLPEQVPVDGFRLDAVKHIPAWFFRDWVGHMRNQIDPDLFVVAEYWHPDMDVLKTYLDRVDKQLMLFDVALHHRFHEASLAGEAFDMRTIFEGSLVSTMPEPAVTIVDNHDTQLGQALEAAVEPWFKPLAYALILLREQGLPCVFYPDLYGARYTVEKDDGTSAEIDMPAISSLPKLIEARARYANGTKTDIFDQESCVGFIRHGSAEGSGCVVILSNGAASEKLVDLGSDHANLIFTDFLGHHEATVTTDAAGKAPFPVNGGSVSVWVHS